MKLSGWIALFLIGAVVAAVLAFWGADLKAARIAKALFALFTVLLSAALVRALQRRHRGGRHAG